MNVFDLSAKITMDINGYLKGMDTAKAVAISTMGAIGGEVSNFVSNSVQVGTSFDKSMSQVAATMGGTMSDLQAQVGSVDTAFGEFDGNLREYAQFMGKNTAFSATQAADALNYMALAGYDTQKSMEMLPNVLNLAAAGNFDLARASDMVTDTQTAFGISTKRTNQMVDEMAKAASSGNTSVEQLGDAFLTVGGLAKELNGGMVDLADGTQSEVDGVQELEIALTAMANAGVKGSEAGTHMRNMLLKLSSPTDEGAKQFKALGVEVFDAEGKMRSLREVFGDLDKSLSKLTQEEKIQAISEIFNTRDMASAEALLAAVGQDWDAIGEKILDAEGAAKKMADTQLDNLAGDTTLFESAMEGLQIAISDGATPALRFFTQEGTKLISGLTDAISGLPEPLQTVISTLGLVGGKALEVTPQVVGLASNFSILAQNIPAVGNGIGKLKGLLANPIFLAVAAGIAAAVTAFMKFREQVEQNTEAIREFKAEADTVAEGVDKAVEGVRGFAQEGFSAADASDKLAEAQANLEALQEASADTAGKAAEGQRKYNESVMNGVTQMANMKESGDIVFDIFDGLTNGAMHMAAGMQSVKEAQDLYTESTNTLAAAKAKATSEMWAAQNAVSGYGLLTMEMTEAEKAATEETLNMISLRNTEPAAYQNIVAAIGELNTAHQEEVETVQGKISSIQEAMENLKNAYEVARQSAYDSITQTTGLFNNVTVEVNQSVTDMITALESQLKFMDDYADNMDKAAQMGIDEGLLERLSDGSTESAAILQAIVDDGGAHMNELNEKFRSVEEGKQDFADRVAEMRTDFSTEMAGMVQDLQGAVKELNQVEEAYKVGHDTIRGAIQGAQSQSIYLQQTYANLATVGLNAYRSVWRHNSPSKVMRDVNSDVVLGAILGVEDEQRNLQRAYSRLGTSSLDAYENSMRTVSVETPSADWKRAGSIAAQIPHSDVRETPQKPVLVLDGQIIGQLLTPYITAEIQRVGVNLAGGMG